MSKFSFHSAKSINTGGKSVRRHLEENAAHVARELLRYAENNKRAGVLVELSSATCTCCNPDHAEALHFAIMVAGPFNSPEAALDALSDVASQKPEILKSNQRLQRSSLSGNDITGATE